ncbi:MAG: hypothetical protein WAM11_10485 [Cyanobium sp.]
MSQSPSVPTTQSPERRRQAGASRLSWRRALALGFCFGLGYALSMRLLELPVASGWKGIQRFGVKTFPGTELDSLRRQFGDRQEQIRGDLDLLDLERQQQRDAAELGKRQAEMEARDRSESQQQLNQEQAPPLESPQQDQAGGTPSRTTEPTPEPPQTLTTPSLPPPPAPAAPSNDSAPAAPAANPPTTP